MSDTELSLKEFVAFADSNQAPAQLNQAAYETAYRAVANDIAGRALTNQELAEFLAENIKQPGFLSRVEDYVFNQVAKVSGAGISAMGLQAAAMAETGYFHYNPNNPADIEAHLRDCLDKLPDSDLVSASYLNFYARLVPYCREHGLKVPALWSKGTKEKCRLAADKFRREFNQKHDSGKAEVQDELARKVEHILSDIANPAVSVNQFEAKHWAKNQPGNTTPILAYRALTETGLIILLECNTEMGLTIERLLGRNVTWNEASVNDLIQQLKANSGSRPQAGD